MRLTILIVLAVAAGCNPGGEPADSPGSGDTEALMAADRAFARDAAERRLEGWMAHMAEDAVRFFPGVGVVRGHDEIRDLDGGLWTDEGTSLEWEPSEAGLFGDGTHGFTTGRYELVRSGEDPGGAVVSTGTYLTIWRRDGSSWKVILDTGWQDPPSEHDPLE